MTPAQIRARFEACPQLAFLCNFKNGEPAFVHVLHGTVYRVKSVRERTGLLSSESTGGIAMFVSMEHPSTGQPSNALEAILTGPAADRVLHALEREAKSFA